MSYGHSVAYDKDKETIPSDLFSKPMLAFGAMDKGKDVKTQMDVVVLLLLTMV
jgi:hypothetical protein